MNAMEVDLDVLVLFPDMTATTVPMKSTARDADEIDSLIAAVERQTEMYYLQAYECVSVLVTWSVLEGTAHFVDTKTLAGGLK